MAMVNVFLVSKETAPMAHKILILALIICQFAILPSLAQSSPFDIQQTSACADESLYAQKELSEMRPRFVAVDYAYGRLNDQGLQLPLKNEAVESGIVRKIGIGAAGAALVAMFYFSLLWLILQSYTFVFVPRKDS